MVYSIQVSKEAARRFLVYRQLFMQNKGKDGTLNAVKSLECVQRDPLSVVHRNHHLVLHNRVSDYNPQYLRELLYKDRFLFEYWCNEKSILPLEDFPFFRYRMQNPSQFHSPYYERIKRQRGELKESVSLVLTEIRRRGPISSKELEQKCNMKKRMATSILNLLWDSGDVLIDHVEGNSRYYNLAENLLPSHIFDGPPPTKEEYSQFMVEKHIRAYGLADTRNWRFAWLPLKAAQRKTIVEEMVNSGRLLPVQIEGVKHTFHILIEHRGLLESPDLPVEERVCFVAPLDNLLWNRRLISEVFDFDYSWEVYKPPDKRVYGYYVMPILFESRLVGRFDPKLDRKNNKMIVNSILLEKQSFNREDFAGVFATAFHRFLDFHGVSNYTVNRVEPKDCKKELIDELKSIVHPESTQ